MKMAEEPTSETYYCLPSTEEGRRFKTVVLGSDMMALFIMDVPTVLVWPNHQIDPRKLKSSFEKALDVFPVAAARLIRSKEGLSFVCEKSKGALLKIHRWKAKTPPEKWPMHRWNWYFARYPNATFSPPFGVPLVDAQLNLFSDGGCALCVKFAHCLTDGASVHLFLQTWSQILGKESGNPEWLPKEEVPQPVLSRDVPSERLPTDDATKKQYRHERASLFEIITRGASLIAHYHWLDELAEFRIKTEDVANLKRQLSQELESPKWISSYEAVMTSILRALATADGKNTITCRVIVNIRGRTDVLPKGYFGNALTLYEIDMENKGSLSESAFSFHESLRAGLENESALLLPHFAAEHHRRKHGMKTTVGQAFWVKRILRAMDGEPVVNSWVAFDFFNVDFGLNGQKPAFLRVGESFRNHRHVHIYPSAPDEWTLRMQVPKSTMNRFREALKTLQLDSVLKEVGA